MTVLPLCFDTVSWLHQEATIGCSLMRFAVVTEVNWTETNKRCGYRSVICVWDLSQPVQQNRNLLCANCPLISQSVTSVSPLLPLIKQITLQFFTFWLNHWFQQACQSGNTNRNSKSCQNVHRVQVGDSLLQFQFDIYHCWRLTFIIVVDFDLIQFKQNWKNHLNKKIIILLVFVKVKSWKVKKKKKKLWYKLLINPDRSPISRAHGDQREKIRRFQMDLRFCLRGLVREKLPPVRGCACPGCRGAPARRETKRQCARLRGQSLCARGGRGLEWEGLKGRGRGTMTTPPRGWSGN